MDTGLVAIGGGPTNAYQPLFKPNYSKPDSSSYPKIKFQHPISYEIDLDESDVRQWRDCTDFKHTIRCGNYEVKKKYISKDNYKFYLKHYESGVQVLVNAEKVQTSSEFLKIADLIYLKGELIENSTPLNFRVMTDLFTIRNEGVFYLDNKIHILDRESWKAIIYSAHYYHAGDSKYVNYNRYGQNSSLKLQYSKDDKAIYCKNKILSTDVDNFTFVAGSRYFKDSESVFDMTTCSTIEFDPNSFSVVWNEDFGKYSGYIKDNNKVVFTGKSHKESNVVIEGVVDPETFKVLCSTRDGEFSVDKFHVYRQLVIMKYEDPKIFKAPENCDDGF